MIFGDLTWWHKKWPPLSDWLWFYDPSPFFSDPFTVITNDPLIMICHDMSSILMICHWSTNSERQYKFLSMLLLVQTGNRSGFVRQHNLTKLLQYSAPHTPSFGTLITAPYACCLVDYWLIYNSHSSIWFPVLGAYTSVLTLSGLPCDWSTEDPMTESMISCKSYYKW